MKAQPATFGLTLLATLTLGLATAGGLEPPVTVPAPVQTVPVPPVPAQPAPMPLRPTAPQPLTARADLVNPGGERVGQATFVQASGSHSVQVSLEVEGLTPGQHGMHIHENSACAPGIDPATNTTVAFGAAGGHFDPGQSSNHGTPTTPNKEGHGGDLPMLTAGADGTARASFTTDKISLSGPDGSLARTLMIHAQADDHQSDPAGKSGARIVCGTLVRQGLSLRDYELPGAQTFPEGVAYDAQRGLLLTGSSQNGNIYAVNAQSGEVKLHSPGGAVGRQAAVGLELDPQGRLWIAGGAQGTVSVLDKGGMVLKVLETPKSPAPFVNDLTLAPDGFVYVTDSQRPVIFRVSPDMELSAWLDLSGTPIQYGEGVNLNGIVATPDGRALLIAQTNTGDLWRVDLRTKAVARVMTGLDHADGLWLDGRTLYVARNTAQVVSRVELAADYASGTLVAEEPLGGLRFPTTLTAVGNDLVVVQGQLNRRSGTPETPFKLTRFSRF
ncbi:superoxide dismutase family protein [Deinococcus radiophilus]|uniref:Superoxide dismutase n=1 Tax=Deinococcus radiophilus TaxID=32062 RepID=A0A431W340_9DEIO|nr:superoxide dismutase family protein [Deinococcus radiophilus]RTR29857.1 superoxide dismutase [Deinococcus radiophilus]UFA49791.1 superoxide dismutase family protein [Deinococcus radiophilus]